MWNPFRQNAKPSEPEPKPRFPPYSGKKTTCPKCGNDGVGTQYWPKNGAMLRDCYQCRFNWFEAGLDESFGE
jgi:hypothetical protein